MRLRARTVMAVLVLAGLVAVPVVAPTAAAADEAPTVSLTVSPQPVSFGDAVTLSGEATPALQGQAVQIVDRDGAVVATATTTSQGTYSTQYAPRSNAWVHAEFQGATSPQVKIRVRPVLTVTLTAVHVFGTGLVRGRIRPAVPGGKVDLALVRGTEAVYERTAALKQGITFSIRVPVDEPGVYRARASFSDPDHAPVSVRSAAVATSAPALHVGSSGPAVHMLESRLVELHYRLADAKDGTYDVRTADAVMAFRKVQGLDRVGTVDASVWRALGDPRDPTPRRSKPDFHIEVNQTLQVLYVVDGGQIADILHVSTGKPSTPTHDGTFGVWLKVPGYNDKAMYYSSFFDNGRAIHGYADVPTYNASHGCVRIPIWAATWMYGLAALGTTVIVYH